MRGERSRGKFDFDHHFAFLTNFLKGQNFLLSGILFGSSEKIGLRNTLFIFGRKMVVYFVCLFVLLQLYPI